MYNKEFSFIIAEVLFSKLPGIIIGTPVKALSIISSPGKERSLEVTLFQITKYFQRYQLSKCHRPFLVFFQHLLLLKIIGI